MIPRGPRPSRGKVLEPSGSRRCTKTWAMPNQRMYETDPLICLECGGVRTVVALVEPPQADVIESILRHCGLCVPPRPGN